MVLKNHFVELDTPTYAIQTLKETGIYWHLFTYRSGPPDKMTLALGALTLLNHSDTPNVRIVEDRQEMTMTAMATAEIKPGEEILLRYTNVSEYDFGRET